MPLRDQLGDLSVLEPEEGLVGLARTELEPAAGLVLRTRAGSSEVRVGSPEVRVGSPEVRVGSPEVRVGSPEVRVGSVALLVRTGSVALFLRTGPFEPPSSDGPSFATDLPPEELLPLVPLPLEDETLLPVLGADADLPELELTVLPEELGERLLDPE